MEGEVVSLKSKSLYKVTLFSLKLLPAVMAISFFINTLCVYFPSGVAVITHFLGITMAPLIFMYIASYVFRFCSYHRIFIHYVAIIELLNIIDWYIGIPISNDVICIVHFVITGIFFILALVLYIKKKREDKLNICDYDKDYKKSSSQYNR